MPLFRSVRKVVTGMTKRILAFALTLMLVFSALSISAFAADTKIRQVYMELPDITAEISGKHSRDYLESAKLDSSKLTIEGVKSNSAASRLVYMLIDISTSMSQSSLDELKPGLINYAKSLGKKDKLVLISFGLEYTTVLKGGESDQRIEEAINDLYCDSEGTSFYSALNYAYEKALKETKYDRKYAIVVSDGEDYEKGNSSQEEVLDNYETHTLPVYGMCLDSATKTQADSFGYIARNSGGELFTFSYYDAEEIFNSLIKTVNDVTIYKLASSSKKSAGVKLLTLKTENEKLEQDVLVIGGKDTKAPKVKEIEYDKDKDAFIFTFSENVEGADKNSAYTIEKGSKTFTVISAEHKNNKATVYVDETVYSGTYTFSFNGITDTSDNQNKLSGKEIEEDIKARSIIWKILAIIGIIMIPVAFLAALYFILLNLKKKKQVETIKEVFITQVEEKEVQQIHIKQPDGMKLRFFIDAGNGQFHTVEYNMISSLIVGRSDMCDIFIDDINMSRQHFSLEQVPDGLAARDLETTNGTYVNGVRIQSPTYVRSGDKIMAGNSIITVMF